MLAVGYLIIFFINLMDLPTFLVFFILSINDGVFLDYLSTWHPFITEPIILTVFSYFLYS